ncbi:MAG: hypothetical protein M2R45_01012 [Verrucomicrobia subdivision 3 bacterium]|nr:hypothetical protein [Limisphaerales bacterium]MCS1414124.1 hypothetical protein [Limisphaerales bacterium]
MPGICASSGLTPLSRALPSRCEAAVFILSAEKSFSESTDKIGLLGGVHEGPKRWIKAGSDTSREEREMSS